MRILITGICGFIGSHCGRLLSQDNHVIGVDNARELKHLDRIKDYSHRIELVCADISKNISGLFENVDVVINFAAYTFVDHSIKDPTPFVQSNIIGVFNLLEEARRYNVKRFIQISTDEVYGSREVGAAFEGEELCPGNPYSATKAAADMLCLSYLNTYKIPVIILRCENNYGRWQHPQKAIPTFIKYAIENKPIPLYGDGQHRRMWLNVNDFCSAIKFIMRSGSVGQIYNIGANEEYRNIDIAKMILKHLKKDDEMITFIPDDIARPGHDKRYAIGLFKIRELGLESTHTLKESLPDIIDWYVNNQGWLK